MKIAVIGFGAAAIGFLHKMKNTDAEIHVYEKSKDIFSSSISGIRADGKLFVSKEMGGDIDVDIALQKQLVDFYINSLKEKKVETGSSFTNKTYYKTFYEKGFQPIISDFYHIGTDQLKEVLFNIFEEFKTHKNIKFFFNSEIKDVDVIANKVLLDKTYGNYSGAFEDSITL